MKKILLNLALLASCVNAGELVYSSFTQPEITSEPIVVAELREGDLLEVLNVSGIPEGKDETSVYVRTQVDPLPPMGWQRWRVTRGTSSRDAANEYEIPSPRVVVGPCKIVVSALNPAMWRISYKITRGGGVSEISKPVTIPPAIAADTNWIIKLQVSTDLKNWEDVQSGEFLGSDAMRFFRIQATEQ